MHGNVWQEEERQLQEQMAIQRQQETGISSTNYHGRRHNPSTAGADRERFDRDNNDDSAGPGGRRRYERVPRRHSRSPPRRSRHVESSQLLGHHEREDFVDRHERRDDRRDGQREEYESGRREGHNAPREERHHDQYRHRREVRRDRE